MATIDWEQFNENFQYYDKETISEVIQNFFEESEERLANLERNIAALDFEKLAFNAHSLKSVIGNFMAPVPYEVCRKLEEMGKQHAEVGLTSLFAELKDLIKDLESDLQIYLKG